MGRSVSALVGEYKMILKEDGEVDRSTLMQMLRLDGDLIEASEKLLENIADKILDSDFRNYEQLIAREYAKGLSDRHIAKVLNLPENRVSYIRLHKLGVKPNKTDIKKQREEFKRKVLEMWKKGIPQKEIAKEMNTTVQRIRYHIYEDKKSSNKGAKVKHIPQQ